MQTGFEDHPAETDLVTIVEFADFASPHAAQANGVVREVLEKFPDSVRVVFRQNPKANDEAAGQAARAAVCAHDQQRYWEYRQLLFGDQQRLTTDALVGHAAKLGLNADAFATCLRSQRVSASVSKDVAEAEALDLDGSPEFLVNGIRLSGAHQFKTFARIIESERQGVRRL